MKNLKHIILITVSLLMGAEAASNEEIARDFDSRGQYLRKEALLERVEKIHSNPEQLVDVPRCLEAVTAVLTYHLDHPLYDCVYDLDLLKVTLKYSMFASLHGKALKAVASEITKFTDSDCMPVIHLADQLLRNPALTNPEMEEVKKKLRNLLENNLQGPCISDLLKITLVHDMFSELHARATIALSFSEQLKALRELTSRIEDFMYADNNTEAKPVLTREDKTVVESAIRLLSENPAATHPEMGILHRTLEKLFCLNIKGDRITNKSHIEVTIAPFLDIDLLGFTMSHDMFSELHESALKALNPRILESVKVLESLAGRIDTFESNDTPVVESAIRLLSKRLVSTNPEMAKLHKALENLFDRNIDGNKVYNRALLKMAVEYPMSAKLSKKVLTYSLNN